MVTAHHHTAHRHTAIRTVKYGVGGAVCDYGGGVVCVVTPGDQAVACYPWGVGAYWTSAPWRA